MGFDTTTFVLEIINFLILIWILAHFFYRPVAAVIERRRLSIAASLSRAEELQATAARMQQQYETRLAEWESEKRGLREAWVGELATEKSRQMIEFRQTLAAERERAEILEQRRLRARETELEETALQLAGRFSAKALERLASPAVEARLVQLFIDDLASVSEEQWRLIQRNGSSAEPEAAVSSAFPLDEDTRAQLRQAVSAHLGGPFACRFREDRTLIAGLRFESGPLALGANLRDELAFFNRAG